MAMSDEYTVTIGNGLNVWRNGKLVHEITGRSALMFIAFRIMEVLHKGASK